MSIKMSNVCFNYRCDIDLLKSITLSIGSNEALGLMGLAGSGKSTILNIISGFLKPHNGKVLIDEYDLETATRKELTHIRSILGVMFQFPEEQLFAPNVFEDIAFGLRKKRLPRKEVEHRVKGALEAVDFSYAKIKSRDPHSLGLYDQRRVALAGVMVKKPCYLLLDEPTAGLDSIEKKHFLGLIRNYQETNGTGILMVSHSWDDIAKLCDRVAILSQGQIIIDDVLRDVIKQIPAKWDDNMLPGLADILYQLNLRGWPLDYGVTEVEEAAASIINVLGRNESCCLTYENHDIEGNE